MQLDGVGIDVEALGVLDRFGEPAVARAACRLLSPQEREWCATQPTLAQGVVIVLSCREAAAKSRRGRISITDLDLQMEGGPSAGTAVSTRYGSVEIRIAWRLIGREVMAVGAAGTPDHAADVLDRLVPLLRAAHTPEAACLRSS